MDKEIKAKEPSQNGLFGWLSLVIFIVGICMSLFSPIRHGEALGIDDALKNLHLGLKVCSVGFAFALIGLLKRERPVWPAALGFCVCLLPAVIEVIRLTGLAHSSGN